MRSWSWNIAIAVIALCIGFSAGAYYRSEVGTSAVPKVEPRFVAETTSVSAQPTGVLESSKESQSWKVRARTFAEFKRKRGGMPVAAIWNDSLDPQMALILGLTSEEVDQIDRSIRNTRLRVEQLRLNTAKSARSDDGKTMTITLPPIAAEATPIYKSLVSVISEVLGPDRFDFFNQVAGDRFDAIYDHFGADAVDYEVTLAPTVKADGKKVFAFKRTSHDNGGAVYWSSGSETKGISTDIIVQRFLPQ